MSDRYKGAILSPTAPTVTPQSAGGIYTLSQQTQYQGQGVWPTAVNNPITQSLRFRRSATAYLNRTFGTPTNGTTWTISYWAKLGILGRANHFAPNLSTNEGAISIESDFALYVNPRVGTPGGAGTNYFLGTTQVFRDPSAWYHIVVALDTTQATASNRVKVYVNGTQVTAFSTANYPPQNATPIMGSAVSHAIGRVGESGYEFYYDGLFGEMNYVDGVALTPSSFGTTDAYGIWQPIPYTGAYGTNGFYLPFNPGATLSASYLVVAGGGGGGAGGAGAGGLLTGVTTLASAASYTVTVGAGGTSGNLTTTGGNGGNSVFDAITATGGGGGAGGGGATAGASGGSGGGGTNTGAGGAGTSGQGFAGGAGYTDFASYGLGGGGGGAGAVGGSAASGAAGGNGGVGIPSSISGTATFYAGGGGGGGGGGGTYPAGTGGNGGGGNGNSNGSGSNATANTGGGGGGAGSTGSGGLGGSGIVIVSYPGSARFTGGTITTSGGNTIHTFTSSGTLAGTSTAITNDYSGNGNNWTPNNISLTSGSTYDSMKDVPTNTNQNTANYATGSPVASYSNNITWTNGNLALAIGLSAEWRTSMIPFQLLSNKWYWEITLTATVNSGDLMVGVINSDIATTVISGNSEIGTQTFGYAYYSGGLRINAGTNSAYGATWFTSGDIIGVTFDASSGDLSFYKNGVSQGLAYTVNMSKTYVPAISGTRSGGTTPSVAFNFGQQPFTYTPPTGFLPLNTYNLPTPTILAGDDYFNAVLWTGNGASGRSITGVGFAPDWTWIKDRTGTSSHFLLNTISGATKTLFTNNTSAELTESQGLSAFGSDGFTVGNDTGVNESPRTYVAWNWKANQGTNVSNTQGTITSTVSANTTAGFSIVLWTGNGVTSATVGHGLGVVPAMIICKERSASGEYWHVKHQSTASNTNLFLNQTLGSTSAASVGDGVLSDLTSSTTFGFATAGSPGNVVAVNENGVTNVAYCFSAVAGYSAFGSYAGNASTDGPFVYTGFRPRFVLLKIFSGNTANWLIIDSARNTYNVVNLGLNPDASDAEFTSTVMDFTSNGFKLRSSAVSFNGSGCNYIYACFAENPFKIARAR